LGYTEAERRQRFDQLSARHRLQIQSYIDGVNAWMNEAAATGKLPEGYARNRIEPLSFRVTDSVAISDLMSQRFASGGGAELRNLRYLIKLRNKFGPEPRQQIFDDLFWQNDPASPTTISETASGFQSTKPFLAARVQFRPGSSFSEAALARAETTA